MNETMIVLWALTGIMLAGAGLILLLTVFLAPRSWDEARATVQEGGGRFLAWLNRTSTPRAFGEESR